MKRPGRRRFLAGATGALALAALPESVLAQAAIDPVIQGVVRGAPVKRGRVKLDLPELADNGNSVPVKVTVESPMTAADHVRAIHFLSERNPERNVATFQFGARAGRAEIVTRVRLAGSQRVVALAELSDGSFWMDAAEIVVTLSACIDES
ncbi:MAG TPA: SoxY-related AACIE arm protein [Burkholderiales bacterium]|nr:SoxY-related AACIE arm protein [Burkholderiales bacterium]